MDDRYFFLRSINMLLDKHSSNGDMLQALFPDIKVITQLVDPLGNQFILFTLNNNDVQVELDWWNAPYEEKLCNH